MRFIALICILFLTGCVSLPLKTVPVWGAPAPVTLGAVSYDWPAPLVRDAVNDVIIDEGAVILRTEYNAGVSRVSFAGPQGQYIAEIAVVGPDSSTVTLTHPIEATPTDGITQGFFMALDHRLGLR